MDIEPRIPPTSLVSRENVGSLLKGGYSLNEVRFRQIFSEYFCDVVGVVEVQVDFDKSLVATSNAEPGYDLLSLHRKAEVEGRRIRGLEPWPEIESL